MKKKERIKKCCQVCGEDFFVIQSRVETAKFCSRVCYNKSTVGKPTWNKGKTYEECYGQERADKIKSQNARPGKLNGMYGKTHTEEVKGLMSENRKGTPAYNKGKKFPGLLVNRNQWGANNPSVKKVLRDEGITYEEYLSRYSDKEAYTKLVRSITKQQPIHILENYERRGSTGIEGAYHLDHIYPISKGYKNKIPPELIGSILNLQFIPWEDNVKKFNKVFEDYEYRIFE